MCLNRSVCIVLLVGVPGSGKTFFRTFLESYLCENVDSVLGSVQMCSIAYDDIETVRHPYQGGENNKWKLNRLDITKIVNSLLEDLKNKDVLSISFSDEYPGVSLTLNQQKTPTSTLIVIDDNMYYRSMRYEYFKLAKLHNTSFAQIYFDLSLHQAFKCNNERSNEAKVPQSVIENMFSKIEPPHINHLWERYSVFVSSYANFENTLVFSNILNCLRNALDKPVQTDEPNSNKSQAQLITSSNALHQIDIILKQLINNFIKEQISKKGKDELNFKFYIEKRMKLLKNIKERAVTLPIDLNDAITEDKIHLLKPILSNLLFSR